jgi:hypothetical protein
VDPNIGPRQRRARLLIGVVAAAAGLAGGAWLVAGGAGRAWRLVLFLPFWQSALMILQAAWGT